MGVTTDESAIIFITKDLPPKGGDHNRALYVTIDSIGSKVVTKTLQLTYSYESYTIIFYKCLQGKNVVKSEHTMHLKYLKHHQSIIVIFVINIPSMYRDSYTLFH